MTPVQDPAYRPTPAFSRIERAVTRLLARCHRNPGFCPIDLPTGKGAKLAEVGSRSQVVPVLVAALVCDTAVADPASGKKSLIGIFDTIHVSTFPTHRPMSVYVKLTDAEGFYKMEFRYVRVSSGEVLAKAEGDVQVKNRIASSDFFLSFPPLPIPAEGRYEFQVWTNDVFLGGTFIEAVPRAQT